MTAEYKTISVFDYKTQDYIDVLYIKNLDGSYSPVMHADESEPLGITNFAKETDGNLAAIKTDVDKIPTYPAQDGTDITTPTAMPAGGTGIRGWLSAIWTKLNGSLGVTGTFWQTTQPVAGIGFSIPVTLTVTNGVYTIADVVGGLITFANAVSAAGKRSVIHTITLSGVFPLAYELWFFASDIATPAANNALFTLVAADAAQCKGVIPINVSDYCMSVAAFNIATLRSVGFEFTCPNTTLYAYLKAVAVTSPGTTTLTLTIKGEYID